MGCVLKSQSLNVPHHITPGEEQTETGEMGWMDGGLHHNGNISGRKMRMVKITLNAFTPIHLAWFFWIRSPVKKRRRRSGVSSHALGVPPSCKF